MFLEAEDPERAISLYINSPGGSVTAGLAIYDTMQYIRAPVGTLCLGQAASMGSLLLAAGEPGMRRCLPNAQVMLHQPSGACSASLCVASMAYRVGGVAAMALRDRRREHERPERNYASMAWRWTYKVLRSLDGVGEIHNTHRDKTKKKRRPAHEGKFHERMDALEEILKTREKLNKIYVSHTGKDVEAIERVMDRDTYFTAEEAKEFGVVDEVVAARERPGKPSDEDEEPLERAA